MLLVANIIAAFKLEPKMIPINDRQRINEVVQRENLWQRSTLPKPHPLVPIRVEGVFRGRCSFF